MKKGFTLIELLCVIVIIGIISLITVPAVLKSITKSRNESYERAISNIQVSMRNWVTDKKIYIRQGEKLYLTISQLKHDGYLEEKSMNPKTGDMFPNDAVLTVENVSGGYIYSVSLEGTNTLEYNGLSPYLEFVGEVERTINIGDAYTDREVYAYLGNGTEVEATITKSVIGSAIDTSAPGTYYTKYSAVINNIPVSLVDTLHVRNDSIVCVKTVSNPLYQIGDEYTCDPGDGVSRKFYLLSINTDDVTLIMDKNIGDFTSWSLTNATTAVDALAYLKMKTKNWTSVDVALPSATALAHASGVNNTINNVSVLNLLYTNLSCVSATCSESGESTDEVLGYWLAEKADANKAYSVSYSGTILSSTLKSDTSTNGVRPAITVSKDKVKN